MRTSDPPPHQAPHVRIAAAKKWEADRDAFEAALEAKYGVPYDKLPSALKSGAPKRPRKNARRFAYTVYDRSWRQRWSTEAYRRGIKRNGWRYDRKMFLADVERFRQAEVEVRKQRIVKKGRGKPLPKNHFAQRRDAVERRDFAEKNW